MASARAGVCDRRRTSLDAFCEALPGMGAAVTNGGGWNAMSIVGEVAGNGWNLSRLTDGNLTRDWFADTACTTTESTPVGLLDRTSQPGRPTDGGHRYPRSRCTG